MTNEDIILSKLQTVWNETMEDYRLTLFDPTDFCFLRANIIGANLSKAGFGPLYIRTNATNKTEYNYQTNLEYIDNKATKIKHYKCQWTSHIVCGVQIKNFGIIVFDPILFDAPETLDNWMNKITNLQNNKHLEKSDLKIRKFKNTDKCFFDNLSELYKTSTKLFKPKKTNKLFFPYTSELMQKQR